VIAVLCSLSLVYDPSIGILLNKKHYVCVFSFFFAIYSFSLVRTCFTLEWTPSLHFLFSVSYLSSPEFY